MSNAKKKHEFSKSVQDLESTFSKSSLLKSSLSKSPPSNSSLSRGCSDGRKAKFGVSVQNVSESLLDSKRSVKSELQQKEVPVFHTFLIKEIKDSDAGPQVIGTFVQRVFGIPPPEKSDPSKRPYFDYRFNEYAAKHELVDLRKTEYESAKYNKRKDTSNDAKEKQNDDCINSQQIDGSDRSAQREGEEKALKEEEVMQAECALSRHTFQVKAPLELDVELDCFPFTVTRATVDVEMSSREDKRDKNVLLRPTFLLHNIDRRNNICIQELLERKKKVVRKTCKTYPLTDSQSTQTDLSDPKNMEHNLKLKLDGMDDFAMVSPYPEITYQYDSKKEYCPRFSVSFLLVEEGMPKFIRIILPMVLICAMNTVNVVNDFVAWRDDTDQTTENATDGADRYLNNAATLALTAVFILPGIAPCRNHSRIISWNDKYVLLVFTALTLSSIPPRLIGFPHLGFVGMAMFWISFLIPIMNMVTYGRFIREIAKERRKMVKNSKKVNPFLKEGNYKEWRAHEVEAVDEDCTFVGDIVQKAIEERRKEADEKRKGDDSQADFKMGAETTNTKETAKNAEEGRADEIWPEDEEFSFEYKGNKYTVSRSGKKFLVSY